MLSLALPAKILPGEEEGEDAVGVGAKRVEARKAGSLKMKERGTRDVNVKAKARGAWGVKFLPPPSHPTPLSPSPSH